MPEFISYPLRNDNVTLKRSWNAEVHGGGDRNELRQVEAASATGKNTSQACRDGCITGQSYYRWRKEPGDLKLVPGQALQGVGEEKLAGLKRLVVELWLEKQILQQR